MLRVNAAQRKEDEGRKSDRVDSLVSCPGAHCASVHTHPRLHLAVGSLKMWLRPRGRRGMPVAGVLTIEDTRTLAGDRGRTRREESTSRSSRSQEDPPAEPQEEPTLQTP